MTEDKDVDLENESNPRVYYNPTGVKAMSLIGPEALGAMFSHSSRHNVDSEKYLSYCLSIDKSKDGMSVYDVVFVKYDNTEDELPHEMLNYVIKENQDNTFTVNHYFCMLT